MRSRACSQHARSYAVNAKIVGLAGALVAFLASSAGAQTLTVEKARAIVAYWTARRIERAKTLLANPGASITEVAFQVGFSGTSAFSAAFRRVTGQTAP